MTWDEAVELAQRIMREWRAAKMTDRDVRLMIRALQREWYERKTPQTEKQNEQKADH